MRNRTILFLALLLVAGIAFAGGKRESAQPTDQAAQSADETTTTDQQPPIIEVQSTTGTPIGATDPSQVAATVNGVVIPQSDLDRAVAQTVQQYQAQGQAIPDSQLSTLRSQLLEQLIAEELIYQEALRNGVTESPTSVESQFQQLRGQYSTDEAWQQALTQNATTEEELRSQLGRNSIMQSVITSATANTAAVTDADIKAFYDANPQYFQQGEQVAARHILISTSGLTTDAEIADAKARAEAIRQQLLDGADFAELAKAKSEGPSAPNGGDLGTFGRGQMVSAFEDAAFALDVGQISDVVQTQYGFHIIQVTEKIPASVTPIDDVTPSIKNYLTQQRQSDALQAYIKSLRDQADVVVNGAN